MKTIRSVRNTCLNLFAIAGFAIAPVAIAPIAVAQQVTNVNPTVNSQNVSSDSSIYGSFDASTGRIDMQSVKIFVNNQDVTSQSVITGNFFSYRPTQALRPGENQVRVEFKNTNGQGFAANWSFQVEQPRAALDITSVSHNGQTTALGSGSTFLATINGTPGAQASVLILDGTTMRRIPAQEVSSGVYVATLNLNAGDRFNEGIVIGRLERDGKAVYNAASQAVAFQPNVASTQVTQVQTTPTTPGQPMTTPQQPTTTPQQPTTTTLVNLQPSFTSHQDGGIIASQGFTLIGQTQPNAGVRVVVTSPTLFGESTLVSTTVTADSNGTFTVPVPRPLILTAGIRYNVTAIANNGSQTAQTRITLTQK
ncbi:hypothetical protein [Oscillatoria sp. FACHB-1406]|uniref:hypothetical protein n=1 Tax=Oscillatoria sp. FACHB-1406 TaxID=2692846 RepID=UPI0016856D58|nr:hypothetical protein [Oscillatoria sp. FACHB-1406]MBD2578310.1 hypothetical protein [Oscillatoria sp. FACHB-1406]